MNKWINKLTLEPSWVTDVYYIKVRKQGVGDQLGSKKKSWTVFREGPFSVPRHQHYGQGAYLSVSMAQLITGSPNHLLTDSMSQVP